MALNSLGNAMSGVGAVASANRATDGLEMANKPFRCPVGIGITGAAPDTDFTLPVSGKFLTPITVTAAQFLPWIDIAESDSNLITMELMKGNLAAGALTSISTAWTTAATGQVGDLVAGDATTGATARAWTITTAASANLIAVDLCIYLKMTQTGTGPAWAGMVEIFWEFTG